MAIDRPCITKKDWPVMTILNSTLSHEERGENPQIMLFLFLFFPTLYCIFCLDPFYIGSSCQAFKALIGTLSSLWFSSVPISLTDLCSVSIREQFLKSNAQLTFRCRQLLSELSYIYPIDVVSWATAEKYLVTNVRLWWSTDAGGGYIVCAAISMFIPKINLVCILTEWF